MKENHVVTCFVENDGSVLIVKRSSRVGTYQQRWSGISGHIEPGKIHEYETVPGLYEAWERVK